MLERLIMAIVLTLTLNWFLQINQKHSQVNTSSHSVSNQQSVVSSRQLAVS